MWRVSSDLSVRASVSRVTCMCVSPKEGYVRDPAVQCTYEKRSGSRRVLTPVCACVCFEAQLITAL